MVRNRRIRFLASLLKGFDCVIDVGSDHGYVLEEAFKCGYIQKGIATDVREMPLQSAVKTLKDYPVRAILSDGFLAVNDHFDAAVIAGMGATLITDIMSHAPLHDAVYIIQANDKHRFLRKRLNGLGFQIVDEHIVYDRFAYIIFIVKRGIQQLTEEDQILGPFLKYKDEAAHYYEKRIHQFEKIMKTADEARQTELKIEYDYLIKHQEA